MCAIRPICANLMLSCTLDTHLHASTMCVCVPLNEVLSAPRLLRCVDV